MLRSCARLWIFAVTALLCLAPFNPRAEAAGARSPTPGSATSGSPTRCLLVVRGTTYLNGPCEYEALDGPNAGMAKGSFQIAEHADRGDGVLGYFAQLQVATDFASLSWNGDRRALHAQAALGEDFKRRGACWANAIAKICAWR